MGPNLGTSLRSRRLTSTNHGEVGKRWVHLDTQRGSLLTKARQFAELTIPSVLPPEGHNETQEFFYPFQSLGARGVANLTSRLVTTLMPPGLQWFKLVPDYNEIEDLDDLNEDELEDNLIELEGLVVDVIEQQPLRVALATAVEHLAVTGSTCLYFSENGRFRTYRLDEFVCVRQPDGELVEVIVVDFVYPSQLGMDLLSQVDLKVKPDSQEPVPIFTRAKKLPTDSGFIWEVTQELNGKILADRTQEKKTNPFIVPRWREVSGEHYGRGHVEDYSGDLRTYEGLQKAILELAAIMSKVIPLVNPAQSFTNIDDLASAENGEFKPGRSEDVTLLELGKGRDFAALVAYSEILEQRLGAAFLLRSAVQPDGERVTAYQIRQLVEELDGSLGGIFSVLSSELQVPLVRVILNYLEEENLLPEELLPEQVKPQIITGLEALGREQDLVKITTAVQTTAMLGDAAMQYLRMGEHIRKIYMAVGVDPSSFIKTEEEVTAEREQAQATQQAIQSVGRIAEQNLGA